MVNAVKHWLTHYETLGLTPEATDDQIGQAFARKMSECRWHPMAASAQICIAYETLSDRFKRADYDRANGLVPKARPRLAAMTIVQEQWAPFIASAPTNALGQSARDAAAEPHVTAQSNSEVPAAMKPRSRVVDSMRDLARLPALGASSNRYSRLPDRQPLPANLESQVRQIVECLPQGAIPSDSEDRLLDWKRPALAIGGFVLAAGLIGALAGLSLANDDRSTPTEPSAALAAPVFGKRPNQAALSAAPLAAEASLNSGRALRSSRPEFWARHIRWRHTRSRVSQRVGESSKAPSGPVASVPNFSAADQIANEPPVAQPAAAAPQHPTI
jgi:DnaJ-like protein